MNTTTNLGLKMPEYSDQADIQDINDNMEILDGKIGAVGGRSIQEQIGSTALPTTAQTLTGAIAEHETDLGGKANKVSSATNGNLAGLDSNGNLTDSGVKPEDFALASEAATVNMIGDLKSALNYFGENLVIEGFEKEKVYHDIKSLAVKRTGEYLSANDGQYKANANYNCYVFDTSNNNISDILGKKIKVKGHSASAARLIVMRYGVNTYVYPSTTASETYETEVIVPDNATAVIINELITSTLTTIVLADEYSYDYHNKDYVNDEEYAYFRDHIKVATLEKVKEYKSIKEDATLHDNSYWNASSNQYVTNSAYKAYSFDATSGLGGVKIHVKGYSGSNARLIVIAAPSGNIIYPNVTTEGIYEQDITVPLDYTAIVVNQKTASYVTEIGLSEIFSYNYVGSTAYNILYRKKLCSAGDSLTAGLQAETDHDTGEHKTYAYIVAKNNAMNFTNVGLSGDLIGDTTINGVLKKGFSNHRYNEIPADLDYLTIFYGWNDEAYGPMQYKDAWCYEQYGAYYNSCTSEQKAACDAAEDWATMYIGTVNDNTTATWCGAWNIVLNYYRQNRTGMKVGVILPYVNNEGYRTALIALCKKYGVAYIDGKNANQWFSTGYSEGLGADMVTYLKATYTADGLHPNTLGHLMESSKYEAFLRSL